MLWVPSHISVLGNEQADRAAKYSASAPLIRDDVIEQLDFQRYFGRKVAVTKINSKWSLPPTELPVLIEKLQDPNLDFRFNIKVILTEHAKHFLDLVSMPQSAEYWMMRWNGKPEINAVLQ
ncbi:uncharacterized protein ACN427_013469 isoform 1-T3 [Glossina fuscipes fuscipes]